MKTAKRLRNKRAKTMKGGKVFEGLRYISEGAQGGTFLTRNQKLLKFIKRGQDASEEVKIHKKLNELRLPYFPRFLKFGKGYTNNIIVNTAENGTSSLLPGFTQLFNSEINGEYEYDYILMEYISNSKKFPEFIKGKIEELIPGMTRPLTIEEINILVNICMNIICKLTFAFYVAMKVFNFTHKDFHMNNCLIRANGDPVIIDFGGSKIYNNTRISNIPGGTGYDVRSYINQMFGSSEYSDDFKSYIVQLATNYKISRLLEIPFGPYRQVRIETIAATLESIQTNSDVQPFEYMRTFTNIGIDKSEIARAGIKIKYRVPIHIPQAELTREDQIQELIRRFGQAGTVVNRNTVNRYLTQAHGNRDLAVSLFYANFFANNQNNNLANNG